jgi:hypothetical protein
MTFDFGSFALGALFGIGLVVGIFTLLLWATPPDPLNLPSRERHG